VPQTLHILYNLQTNKPISTQIVQSEVSSFPDYVYITTVNNTRIILSLTTERELFPAIYTDLSEISYDETSQYYSVIARNDTTCVEISRHKNGDVTSHIHDDLEMLSILSRTPSKSDRPALARYLFERS
jgi:hypothetical protein